MNAQTAKGRTIGIVEFPLSDLLTHPRKYTAIIERLAIARMQADLTRDRVTYIVWDPSLKAVHQCDVTPRYDVTVWDGRLVFSPCQTADSDGSSTHAYLAAAST